MPLIVFRPKRGNFGNLSPESSTNLTLTAETGPAPSLTAETPTVLVLTAEA